MIKPVHKVFLYTAGFLSSVVGGCSVRESIDFPLYEVRQDLKLDNFDLNGNGRIDSYKPSPAEIHLANTILDDGDKAIDETLNLVKSFDIDKDGFLNSWERFEIDRLVKDLDNQGRKNLWYSARLIEGTKRNEETRQELEINRKIREVVKD